MEEIRYSGIFTGPLPHQIDMPLADRLLADTLPCIPFRFRFDGFLNV